MTEPGQVHAEPHAGRFRFSLRALFLFVLVAGLAFSHLVTSWRLNEARVDVAASERRVNAVTAENKALRIQLGELVVDDPSRLHTVASPFFRQEDLKWRWHVFAPGSTFKLYAAVAGFPYPGEGVSDDRERVLICALPKGKLQIEAAVRRNYLDQWQFTVSCSPERGLMLLSKSLDIAGQRADWLNSSDHSCLSLKPVESVKQSGEPLVLLHHATFDETAQELPDDKPTPTGGVMLWIEEE